MNTMNAGEWIATVGKILAEIIRVLSPVLTPVVGAFAAFYGIAQYRKQNLQKSADMFFAWRKEIDEEFGDIQRLLDGDDPEKDGAELRKISFEKREAFVTFHEEIALALNSGLLKPEVALYIFGQYAILCWDNSYFWEDLNRNKWYWHLFKEFVVKMRALREKAETQWPSFSKGLKFDTWRGW
jgi:hypothetical protein